MQFTDKVTSAGTGRRDDGHRKRRDAAKLRLKP
jgi:hypothetical protein